MGLHGALGVLDFGRVLRPVPIASCRQNRRVVQDVGRQAELEQFHEVLTDISFGVASNAVRHFVLEAYVRGAVVGNGGA